MEPTKNQGAFRCKKPTRFSMPPYLGSGIWSLRLLEFLGYREQVRVTDSSREQYTPAGALDLDDSRKSSVRVRLPQRLRVRTNQDQNPHPAEMLPPADFPTRGVLQRREWHPSGGC